MSKSSLARNTILVTEIETPSGARATAEGEMLSLHRSDGALIASFDAATGELTISAPRDLRLAAPSGRVLVEGRDGVTIIAARKDHGRSSVDVTPHAIAMSTPKVDIDAEVVDARSDDLRLSSKTIAIAAQAADLAIGAFELRAERILERATDVFRTTEGLLETRAGRLRTIVQNTLELFGRRTTITSEKDTRIDGERILLG